MKSEFKTSGPVATGRGEPGKPGFDSLTVAGTPAVSGGELPKAATRNACKLCSPLGASLVFKGIRGCLPFLHGSQGCATYIRRYMISHFREPVDIASSSFSEDDAIFGGARNFADGVENVIQQYTPEVIGVATTCLAETIGENMIGMIKAYQKTGGDGRPPMVHVSTPAYTGTHADGFREAVREVLAAFAEGTTETDSGRVNLLPSMMSCEDLRHLRFLAEAYGLKPTLLPDYSDTLEGEAWGGYHRIAPGGTSLGEIRQMGSAAATIEIGHSRVQAKTSSAADFEARTGVVRHVLGWPVGLRLSDELMTSFSQISGRAMPATVSRDRGRLVDAYVDGHKYVSGKRAAIFGEPDLVAGLAAFLSEIGIRPVVCATGSKERKWADVLANEIEGGVEDVEILTGADHATLAARVRECRPDFLLGSSKGYPLSRETGIPLVRIGFPIHDRFGGQRQLSVGYRGTLELFDRIVNRMMDLKQSESESGYSYV